MIMPNPDWRPKVPSHRRQSHDPSQVPPYGTPEPAWRQQQPTSMDLLRKKWVLPTATGLLGLTVGGGLGAGNQVTVTPLAAATVTESATITQTATVTSSRLITVTAKAATASAKKKSVAGVASVTHKATSAVRSVYYANCSAARAAGAAPILAGQPGYRSGLDRDGDGVACE